MLPEYKCPITSRSEVPVILDHASSIMTKENSVCAYHPSARHTHLNASHDCTFTCLGISYVLDTFFNFYECIMYLIETIDTIHTKSSDLNQHCIRLILN